MTWAGRSRSRSLARPVSARTRRTSPSGNVLAITPRLTWSLTRMPAGRPAGARAIAVARPRASASMDQLHPYVNGIGIRKLLSGFGVIGPGVPRGGLSGRGGILPRAPVPPVSSPTPVNLSSLIDDARRYESVRQHRRPEGVRCPRRAGAEVARDEARRHRQRYRRAACGARSDDLAG